MHLGRVLAACACLRRPDDLARLHHGRSHTCVLHRGPGSEMRRAMGVAVFAGMVGVTLSARPDPRFLLTSPADPQPRRPPRSGDPPATTRRPLLD